MPEARALALDALPAEPQPVLTSQPVAGGLRWCVQRAGTGPAVLLLHGTGSAGRSWRDILPALAAHATVIAPDLPGHGQTADPGMRGLSLPGMAAALRALLDHLQLEPAVVIGHSAGAAVACRMALDGQLAPRRIIALNGALLPPLHMPLQVFSPLARLLAVTPLIPAAFALRARNPAAVSRLLAGTGSRLDAAGLAFYQSLLCDPRHVSAALRMMAVWDLAALARDLDALATPLDLVVAEGDRTMPPAEALRVQRRLPAARLFRLPGLGHLAHEEDPVATLAVLARCLAGTGTDGLPAASPAPRPVRAAAPNNRPEGATSGHHEASARGA